MKPTKKCVVVSNMSELLEWKGDLFSWLVGWMLHENYRESYCELLDCLLWGFTYGWGFPYGC